MGTITVNIKFKAVHIGYTVEKGQVRDMRGYNPQRTNKQEVRKTKCKVLTVWNGKAWTRVSANIPFYSDYLNVTHSVEVNEHRTEYYNDKNECVMIFEH